MKKSTATILIITSFALGLIVSVITFSSSPDMFIEGVNSFKLLDEIRRREKLMPPSLLVSISDETLNSQFESIWSSKKEYQVSGYIVNNADILTIKDIGIRVNFISETGTTISSHEFIIYKELNPRNVLKFKEPVPWPEKAKTFSSSVYEYAQTE